jgi:hypothetical protein
MENRLDKKEAYVTQTIILDHHRYNPGRCWSWLLLLSPE